jgi:hypothetical protein
MRVATLLIGCLLAARSLAAQGTAGVVAGVVRDEVGRPLVEALVVIDADSNPLRARTSAEGRFSITGVSVGRHEIRVVRIGYAPHVRIVDVGPDGLELTVEMRSVPIPLETVAVRVSRLGLYGLVATRGMELMPHEPRSLRSAIIEVLHEPYRTTSGADGRFSIGQLGEGAHSILVRLDRYATRMVPVYVPPDAGLEITVVLDSVIADYQRQDDDRLRSISQRLRLAPNPAAFVSLQELAGPDGMTLHEALRYAPSTLSRGLVVRNDITCVYLDGVPRPGMTADDIMASEVQAVEVYGANPQAAVPLENVAPWNPNTFCGTGRRPGVFAAVVEGPRGARPPRTVAGDNIARVIPIWTTGRR